jgi:hypothetical protein
VKLRTNRIRDDYNPGKTKTINSSTYNDTTETGKVIMFRKPILSASDSVFFRLKESPVIVDPNKAQPVVPTTTPGKVKVIINKSTTTPATEPTKTDTVPVDKKEPVAPKKQKDDSVVPE